MRKSKPSSFKNLLTQHQLGRGLRRNPKENEGDGGEQDARQDEDVVVQGGSALEDERELEVNVRLRAAGVVLNISTSGRRHDLPRVALDILGEVDLVPGDLVVGQNSKVQLVAIVGPRAELELALLLVEGEGGHVQHARASVDGLRHPQDLPVVHDDQQGVPMFLQSAVSTGRVKRQREIIKVIGSENGQTLIKVFVARMN